MAQKHICEELLNDGIKGRFWSKVDIRSDDDCWLWKGSRNHKGYGSFNAAPGVTKIAHRIAYLIGHGELDSELMVCHVCDTPGCCNPRHLFQGTAKQNSEDMVAKGRSPLGEKQGHTHLTAKDVLAIKAMWASGRFLQKVIAEHFSIAQQTVSRIITNKDWSHINGIAKQV